MVDPRWDVGSQEIEPSIFCITGSNGIMDIMCNRWFYNIIYIYINRLILLDITGIWNHESILYINIIRWILWDTLQLEFMRQWMTMGYYPG